MKFQSSTPVKPSMSQSVQGKVTGLRGLGLSMGWARNVRPPRSRTASIRPCGLRRKGRHIFLHAQGQTVIALGLQATVVHLDIEQGEDAVSPSLPRLVEEHVVVGNNNEVEADTLAAAMSSSGCPAPSL